MKPAAASTGTSAVVFAYHNVGARALRALLDADVEVRLVVTHQESPTEAVWFASVAHVAAEWGLPCIVCDDPMAEELLAQCRAADPDFLFSFYFRKMLPAAVLAVARRGAFNLHGSLLPRYRGRAPVNWAILHGERETGATLHVMDGKPDHGAIVDQMAVPILRDDTAREVFDKVTVAAELTIVRALPRLIDGSAVFMPQRSLPGQYFGERRPEDGRIPPTAEARRIHDLVRAVAPPEYPGAFFDAFGHRVLLARTMPAAHSVPAFHALGRFAMFALDGHVWIDGSDGARLRVLSALVDGMECDAATFTGLFGDVAVTSDN